MGVIWKHVMTKYFWEKMYSVLSIAGSLRAFNMQMCI